MRFRNGLLVLNATLLLGCSSALPQPLARYPEAIHIVELDFEAQKDARPFGWPAVGGKAEGKFTRDLSVGNGDNVRKLHIECSYAKTDESCASITLKCSASPSGGHFEVSLSQDGSLTLAKPETAKEAILLVPMNDAEQRGEDLRKTAVTSLDLVALAGTANRPNPWGAQVVEARLDETSGDWATQRLITDDFKFNLLLTNDKGLYVSVHQLHPSYERTFAILATSAHLWAENRTSLGGCSASP